MKVLPFLILLLSHYESVQPKEVKGKANQLPVSIEKKLSTKSSGKGLKTVQETRAYLKTMKLDEGKFALPAKAALLLLKNAETLAKENGNSLTKAYYKKKAPGKKSSVVSDVITKQGETHCSRYK